MNRIMNAVLVVWVVVLLLFVAFNWQLVWRPVDVVFLFQEFSMPILMWLVLGGTGTAVALRLLADLEMRAKRRRADKEIQATKAKAFDNLTAEFDKMMGQLQTQLSDRIQALLGGQPAAPAAEGEQSPSGTDGEDAAPQLSPETAATLEELKSSPTTEDAKKEDEQEAEAKPKRRWRKKKPASSAADAGE